MQVPLEIAFHHYEPSPAIEKEIRARVADLERIYKRLVSCRVRVERRAKKTLPPVVRIELGIPGRKDLVISHEPEHLRQRFQAPDIRNAIHEAFRIAERQLRDLKEQRARKTKAPRHDAGNQLLGQVAELHPDRDFGFLMTNQGGLLYFHCNSVLVGDFDALKRGDEVSYVEDEGDSGPVATKVRVKEKDASA